MLGNVLHRDMPPRKGTPGLRRRVGVSDGVHLHCGAVTREGTIRPGAVAEDGVTPPQATAPVPAVAKAGALPSPCPRRSPSAFPSVRPRPPTPTPVPLVLWESDWEFCSQTPLTATKYGPRRVVGEELEF